MRVIEIPMTLAVRLPHSPDLSAMNSAAHVATAAAAALAEIATHHGLVLDVGPAAPRTRPGKAPTTAPEASAPSVGAYYAGLGMFDEMAKPPADPLVDPLAERGAVVDAEHPPAAPNDDDLSPGLERPVAMPPE